MARIVNHAEELKVLQMANETYQWELDLSEITRIWTGGCIIRSTLMEKWTKVLPETKRHPLFSLLNKEESSRGITNLSAFVQLALGANCPVAAHTAALTYFLNWQSEQSSANMIQAQRDFFGQHTFERTDQTGSFSYPRE